MHIKYLQYIYASQYGLVAGNLLIHSSIHGYTSATLTRSALRYALVFSAELCSQTWPVRVCHSSGGPGGAGWKGQQGGGQTGEGDGGGGRLVGRR